MYHGIMVEEVKALLVSEAEHDREQAIEHLIALLTSPEKGARERGYELFGEGLNEALYRSCLNYRGLVGGFTHPLVTALARSIETWAESGR